MTADNEEDGSSEPASLTTLVIPCFDEAERLRPDDVAALVGQTGVRVLLVDDGSNDGTLGLLRSIAGDLTDVEVVCLPVNRGKAEAVRIGMQHAATSNASIIGFCDADMATPVAELIRLNSLILADPSLAVLLASRVALLGHQVDRSVARHYLGRIFATAASVVLRTRVYDTQCGAKFFRNTPMLQSALSEPFHSRWAFDVELLGRLLAGGRGKPSISSDEILEVPLKAWSDVSGSKLTPFASVRAGAELVAIARALNAWDRSRE